MAGSRRLRIAYVYDALYPYLLGGGERRFRELAARLAERHEVHYLSWQFWDGPADRAEDGIQLHGMGPAPDLYGADGKRTVGEAARFAARILRPLIDRPFDVVDCAATPYVPLYAAWLGTRLAGTPLVATWHEFWGEHWDEYLVHRPAVARVARWTEAGAVRFGDRHVAVSAFTADRLVAAGLRPDRVRVVGNGLPLEAFAEVPTSAVVSDLIFVGRLIEDKRVDLLIEAVARLRGELPGLRCLVIGDGPERPALEALVAERGLRDRVWFMGPVGEAEKVALLKGSKLLVLPSVREGFGIAAVEGQAAGLVPIVVRSPHSAAPAVVHDGIDGVVCDPLPEALAAVVRSLLGDPFRMGLMRAAAGQAARRWDWDRVALEMEDVYLETARPAESPEARRRRLSWP
jgi:glycosyltransferase involved in cell wall biosynthesis